MTSVLFCVLVQSVRISRENKQTVVFRLFSFPQAARPSSVQGNIPPPAHCHFRALLSTTTTTTPDAPPTAHTAPSSSLRTIPPSSPPSTSSSRPCSRPLTCYMPRRPQSLQL